MYESLFQYGLTDKKKKKQCEKVDGKWTDDRHQLRAKFHIAFLNKLVKKLKLTMFSCLFLL